MLRFSLLAVVFLSGCGIYTGTEGIKYQPDTLISFITPAVQDQIEANRKESYEAGLAKATIPDPVEIDDGSVTIVTGEEVMEAGGSALASVVPFGGAIGLIITLIVGGITRRKK